MADSTERKLTIRKQVTVADPVSGTTRLQLSVAGAVGIQREIFVMKYTPANAYRNAPSTEFNNVAYADELKLPLEHKKSASFYLSSSFCYDFASLSECETFLKSVVRDIQRLLTELNIFEQTEETFDYFDVTADYVDCSVDNPESIVSSDSSVSSSDSSDSSDSSGSSDSSDSSSLSSEHSSISSYASDNSMSSDDSSADSSTSSGSSVFADPPVFIDVRDML